MGKISPVSSKYIVHAHISIEGVVDRPDVIGAIFGQTEGLLGSELELRELQRNGRIGRIEVKSDTKAGKTEGTIVIPSSLDKAETAIIAASLETIQRIGPCNSNVKVEKIEDVRISKRNYVVERAKELLKHLTDSVLPDSQEITDEVAHSVRMMEITEYGKERLPAGPTIDESEEVILVEGRADVLNLLKQGIKNVIAMNGTSVPETIKELSKRKVITAFVDGDRGGNLILKELSQVAEVDFVTKAPDGKEVEEITKKEINKALRSRISMEQAMHEINSTSPKPNGRNIKVPSNSRVIPQRRPTMSQKDLSIFKPMLDDLVGTRGAYILDQEENILGKVPISELSTTIRNLKTGINTIILDGIINTDLVKISERANIKYLIGMESKVNPSSTKILIHTKNTLS